MRILAIVNQKGGCGKTTTAIQLASRLAALRRRTLLVDLDPQGHATLGLGVGPPGRDGSIGRVLARSGLDEDAVPLSEILIELGDGLFLTPAGAELAELEPDLTRARGGEERLAEHLAPLAGDFDEIVIDAPPSLGLLTLNALMAAHEVLVPVEPSLFSLHGLTRLVELVGLLTERRRHPVRLRILVNLFDGRSRFARETLKEIRRAFPEQTLRTVIRSSVRVREAAARGLPLDRHAPRSPIARDYAALAEEIQESITETGEATRPGNVPGLRVTRDGVYLSRNDIEPDRVRLAGDFNDWVPDSGVVLDRHENGSWTKFFPLGPGHYQYKLVVDGRWICDPLNPLEVPSGIGTTNSVLEIGR
jgi:chromosome partitioning protein